MKRFLVTLLGLGAVMFLPAQAAGPREGFKQLPTELHHFPPGATVTPALLLTDVVKGEAYDSAGLSKCDFLLGFDAPKETRGDLWSHPEPNTFRRNLELASRGGGAYLRVFKRTVVTLPDGKSGDAYELAQPQPKVLLNPTPGNHAVAATVFALVVTDVVPHSPAEALGLRTGDLVYSVNDENVFRTVNSAVAANEGMEKAVRDNAGTINLQVKRCEPSGDGYVLRKRDLITFVVSDQTSTP